MVLKERLEQDNIICYGDWDLTAAVEFAPKLKELVLASTLFLFIITPDSINSGECKKEITVAVENKKVILPISRRDHGDDNLLDSAIRAPQWVFLRTEREEVTEYPKIIEALKTDFDLMEIHSRLLLNVDEWVRKKRSSSYLLKKEPLKEAEDWLQRTAVQPDKLPQPTSLQVEYIVASQRSRAKGIRVVLGITVAIILLLSALSVYALLARGLARENELTARENERQANENLKRFKIEQFNRNLRNGKVYLDAEEYCLAKEVLDSAQRTIEDSLCRDSPEILSERTEVLHLFDSSRKKCPNR